MAGSFSGPASSKLRRTSAPSTMFHRRSTKPPTITKRRPATRLESNEKSLHRTPSQGGSEIGEGEIVLLDTGWEQHFRTVRYDQHPSLSPEAAQWLANHRVKLVGLDVATPDHSLAVRPPDFDSPVRQILLSNGVLIGEHLAGLTALADQRVDVLFLPLRIEGADGGPARPLARPRTGGSR